MGRNLAVQKMSCILNIKQSSIRYASIGPLDRAPSQKPFISDNSRVRGDAGCQKLEVKRYLDLKGGRRP